VLIIALKALRDDQGKREYEIKPRIPKPFIKPINDWENKLLYSFL
jgi:hypothetical protein